LAFNDLPEQQNFGASSVRPTGTDLCWIRIWKAKVPQTVKNFSWKAASTALATEENKLQRNIRVTGSVIFVVWRKKMLLMLSIAVHMLSIFGVQCFKCGTSLQMMICRLFLQIGSDRY
jgi:hypothetical protein